MINRENVLKHLGLLLDDEFSFVEPTNKKSKKANKGITSVEKLHLSSSVRPYLDCGCVIFVQPNDSTLP